MTATQEPVLPASELDSARSRIAALEQLLDVFERAAVEQHDRLSESLRDRDTLLERERSARHDAESARRALEESENRLRFALAAGRMGTWEWDVERQRVIWSPELEALYGLDAGTFEGTMADYERRIHPDDRAAALHATMSAVEALAPTHHVLHRILTAAGEVRWLESHGRFFYATDGRPLRLVGVSTDVTERREIELARDAALAIAERARAELQRVFAQAPAAIGVTSGPEHVFQSANPLFHMLIGGRDVVGKTMRAAFPELEGQPFFALMDQVYATGKPFVGNEVPATYDRTNTGRMEQGFFNFVYQPLLDLDGKVAGVMIHAVEVTELVNARHAVEHQADELRRLADALERSNRDLDQFAYVASHDLKAPLRGISNLAAWIEDDVADALPPSSREHLQLLRGRVRRMEALIDGILAYSRAGRRRSGVELISAGQVVREVIDLLAAPAEVVFEIAPDLPSVMADRAELQQVFLNLISNALRHGLSDAPRIRVHWRDTAEGFEFAVSDNGPGIEPSYHDRVWGIFQTLHSRDRVESTGIGLAVVKKIVESAGGRVWLESKPGEGASFCFLWPKSIEPETRT